MSGNIDEKRQKEAMLANIAYYNDASRASFANKYGYKYKNILSDHNTAVFTKDGKYYIAYRGSVSRDDWYNNFFTMGKKDKNDEELDPDTKKDKQLIDAIRRDEPNVEIFHSGHSRGGKRARDGYYYDKNGGASTFNTAYTENEAKKFNKLGKLKDNIFDTRASGDIVSSATKNLAGFPNHKNLKEVNIKKAKTGLSPLFSTGVAQRGGQLAGLSPRLAKQFNTIGGKIVKGVDYALDMGNQHSISHFIPKEEQNRIRGHDTHTDERDFYDPDYFGNYKKQNLRGADRRERLKAFQERRKYDLDYEQYLRESGFRDYFESPEYKELVRKAEEKRQTPNVEIGISKRGRRPATPPPDDTTLQLPSEPKVEVGQSIIGRRPATPPPDDTTLRLPSEPRVQVGQSIKGRRPASPPPDDTLRLPIERPPNTPEDLFGDQERQDVLDGIRNRVKAKEKIKKIIDQEREDRNIKTIKQIVDQGKYERENPNRKNQEPPPELDDLFTASPQDNMTREQQLEYINLTKGGFLYLNSGNGDSGGRFVNYANNPYGIDDALGQAWTCDWYTACDYPLIGNDGKAFTDFKSIGPMQFHAVGGANGQFNQAGPRRFPTTGLFETPQGAQISDGTVFAHGIDTSEMVFHWDRPFRAPEGYNLTLTCIKARIDETHYNIHNSMANEAVPKYWGYCTPTVDTTGYDEATPHGGDGIIAGKPNAFFYTGYNVMMANRFLPPLNTLDPTPAVLKFAYNPLAYRGKGMTQGLNQISGNDTLLITVQYGYRGTHANGRSITTAITIKAGKYSGQSLADQINKQLEETQINFTFPDNNQEVCPIPADKKRLNLKFYIDVEWLPDQMKYKFRNRSPKYHQGIVGLGPAYITTTTFYVYLVVEPKKLTWHQINDGNPAYVNRLKWANPFPAAGNGLLVMFENRMCLGPLGIPDLDRERINQGQPIKGNVDPVSGEGYPDGIGTGFPSNLSKPNPALPTFDYLSVGTIPIYSEVSGSDNPTYSEGSTLYGQATAGGQGFFVMLPRYQETRWFPNSGTSNPNVWMPQINLVGTPPKKKYEVGISETRNAFQQVSQTDDLTKTPENDEGVFISPMVINLQRTRSVNIDVDYDTNSASSTTNWANNPSINAFSEYEGIRPFLNPNTSSNSNIIASVPISNPINDNQVIDALYEPDNPFNMKTIRIPSNSFKQLTIRLRDDKGKKYIQNGGQYNLVFKIGLIATNSSKFSLPTLNEYNLFIRKFYDSKNKKEKNIQKNKIINL